ncbi:MAG TPA: C25 family cysteine peptidase, partial [Candidatus Thermoplasmatota archaeon]|nr:C25 family cysteine peptidase [Candidatus Thermoplasmatota archaeon]
TSQFCSWDSNNNNIFGEYNWYGMTDSVDLHPDVYLARIPATSGTQVNTVVNKIITYENNPGYQQSWFPNLVLCGGDSFEDNGDINEGEYANQKVADLMTGFNPIDLWVSNGALTGYTPTGSANIKSTINDGCGFVDFHGHGAPDIWATHPHTDFNHWVPTPLQGFWVSDVSSLSNGDMLPIVTVEACDTAEFDTSDSTFNFQFLADTNGGAIAAFGATGIGYSYTGTGDVQGLIGLMGIDTYKGYKTDGANTFGEMWYHALQRYIKASMEDADYKTVEEWEPFGDPTLVIQEPSNPPAKPATPSGPPSGVAGNSYIYTSSTTDPDNDQVYLMFSWGDNTTSGWVGPYNSGATGSATHTWSKQGSYSIKVMAKDTHGKTSDWSDPLPVQMPLTNSYQGNHPLLVFLQWLADRFPHIFQLLHSLLG